MRLCPDIRGTFRTLVKEGLTVTRIAQLFDTTRQTVYRWLKRGKHVGREYKEWFNYSRFHRGINTFKF